MRTLADLPLRKKTVVVQIKESALKPKLLSMRLDEANQIEIAD